MQIYGVTGWKNSGKTGLMERLITEFVARGLRVSSVKHAHHSVDIDQPGKDSHRHRSAGASEVILATAARYAIMHENPAGEPPLSELLARLSPVDLVLVEGYKRDTHPKIEAHRHETAQPLIAINDPTIRAVAANCDLAADCPVFDLDDTAAIADFILNDLGLNV
jgi:molybdopterin-guanine dinucleotide biosynthesis protein MobB